MIDDEAPQPNGRDIFSQASSGAESRRSETSPLTHGLTPGVFAKGDKLDSVKDSFVKYLTSLGLSPKSHKNYKSDLNHFTGWALFKIRSFGSFAESLTEAVPFLNPDLAREYLSFMKINGFPDKTINRRLSTLRHLSKFLVGSQIVDSDFMTEIGNISFNLKTKSHLDPVVREFRAHLETQKISPNTVKNYVSDVRQFLTWLETNHQSPVTSH